MVAPAAPVTWIWDDCGPLVGMAWRSEEGVEVFPISIPSRLPGSISSEGIDRVAGTPGVVLVEKEEPAPIDTGAALLPWMVTLLPSGATVRWLVNELWPVKTNVPPPVTLIGPEPEMSPASVSRL